MATVQDGATRHSSSSLSSSALPGPHDKNNFDDDNGNESDADEADEGLSMIRTARKRAALCSLRGSSKSVSESEMSERRWQHSWLKGVIVGESGEAR